VRHHEGVTGTRANISMIVEGERLPSRVLDRSVAAMTDDPKVKNAKARGRAAA
jgi:hypothetical protein